MPQFLLFFSTKAVGPRPTTSEARQAEEPATPGTSHVSFLDLWLSWVQLRDAATELSTTQSFEWWSILGCVVLNALWGPTLTVEVPHLVFLQPNQQEDDHSEGNNMSSFHKNKLLHTNINPSDQSVNLFCIVVFLWWWSWWPLCPCVQSKEMVHSRLWTFQCKHTRPLHPVTIKWRTNSHKVE